MSQQHGTVFRWVDIAAKPSERILFPDARVSSIIFSFKRINGTSENIKT